MSSLPAADSSETDKMVVAPTAAQAASTTSTTPTPAKKKPPTTFHSLPAELRNYIYHLSDHLTILQCTLCAKTAYKTDTAQWNVLPSLAWGENSENSGRRRIHLGCDASGGVGRHGQERGAGKGKARLFVGGWVESALVVAGGKGTVTEEADSTAVAQPPITKVSPLVRADTLPIFYGAPQFYFTLFDRDPADGAAVVVKWLKGIGRANAARLRSLAIVFTRKQTGNYIKKDLTAGMSEAGVDIAGEVVRHVRLRHPFCRCGWCVVEALRKDGGEEVDGEEVDDDEEDAGGDDVWDDGSGEG
ncbi:hypothetical protein M409DRAFT_24260 [Zasmidium cellare ATCC 36951]|uniref:F-box domain-containing protein n=1 Tax=Zasmidium cellare ATCC 36951 TaxID=1080233 RepID=A0A6A6CGU7_ZASCE|nr:uncharacterized protein M409DRAFT_24260 [Zasmidium cellare ATCC 36951]KAF2165410.1 hypothetical protein M409DRAFT_24260 [Zasmidium cellare ATCC 36951]